MTTALAEAKKQTRVPTRITGFAVARRGPGSAEVLAKITFEQPATRPLRQSSEMLPQLIADHQAEVWRYLRVMGCTTELADDLTQETFLNAFQRPFAYRGKSAAASYLRRTARHRYLNYLKANKRTKELCETEVSEVTWMRWHSSQRSDEEILLILKDCVAKLPQRDRLALELRFRDGRSRQEIAQALSLSEHGARNLLQRAKKKLLRAMKARLGERTRGNRTCTN